MNALVDNTNQVSGSLQKEFILLLKQKIEESIEEDMSVIVVVSNHFMEIRNTIFIDNIELDEEYLYIDDDSFELHTKLNETEITYDNTYSEKFIIIDKSYNDTKIELEF